MGPAAGVLAASTLSNQGVKAGDVSLGSLGLLLLMMLIESDSAVSEESLKSSDNVCKIDMDHARLVAVEADSMSGDGAGSDHGSESRDLYTPTSPAESDHGGCGGYDGGDDGGDNGGCGGLTPSGDRFALPPAVLEDDQWSLISLNSDQRRDIDEMSSADLSESGHTAKTESVHSEAFSDEQAPPSKKARDGFKWKRPSGEDRDPRLRMMFGSFRLNNLIKSGSLAGMLCECSRHLDEGDSNTCARSIMVGKMELSDEDMIRALKRWAVWGLQFDAEPMCKTKHYKMAPRSFFIQGVGSGLESAYRSKACRCGLERRGSGLFVDPIRGLWTTLAPSQSFLPGPFLGAVGGR